MDYVYFYGSSVRMGHKVYIIPILLRPQALVMRLAAPRGKAVAKVGARNRPESADKRSSGRCGTLSKHSTHAICERQHQN